MSADKPNIYLARDKMDYNNQAKVVSLDIEHIMLISNTIYTIERFLDIGKARPFTRFSFRKPFFQRHFRLRMTLIIVYQYLPRNNMHNFLLIVFDYKIRN